MISPLGTVRSSCNHRSTVGAQGEASDGRPTPRARINAAVSLLLTTGSSSIRRTLRTDTPVVAAIEDEPVVRSSDTAALIRARGVGRPSLAAPWAPTLERWLRSEERRVGRGGRCGGSPEEE